MKLRKGADNLMEKLARNPDIMKQIVLTLKRDNLAEELKSIVEMNQ